MSVQGPTATEKGIPHERIAEAGVWIARLHADERSPGIETGFRRWPQANGGSDVPETSALL